MGELLSGNLPEVFLDRLRAKDRAAFEELYDLYADSLYAILLQILHQETLAVKVLQDTFVTVWRKIHTYDPCRGTIFTWLLGLARKRAIQELRARSPQLSDHFPSGITDAGSSGDAGNSSKAAQFSMGNLRTFLTRDQFQLVQLLYVKGYSESDAANILGIGPEKVKLQMREALQALKRQYKNG